jgi:hypothetical protein
MPFAFVAGRGLLAFAMGFLPLLCCFYLLVELSQKIDWLLIAATVTLALVHPMHLAGAVLFSISVLLHRWKRKIAVASVKMALVSLLITFLLVLPTIIEFQYGLLGSENFVDYRFLGPDFELFDMIYFAVFNDGAIPTSNVLYGIGLFVALLLFKQFKEKKRVILYFMIMSLALSLGFVNLQITNRAVSFTKLVYPFSLSMVFANPYAATATLAYSFINPGSPAWVILNQNVEPFYRTVSINELEVFEYIKSHTPSNSTFLIDGAGSFHYGSHGDRIFLMTSRRILYYDLFMEQSEYQSRLDLFRRITVNPDDEVAIESLKGYNVSHIYIGPGDIILNPELFSDSIYYNLIWQKGEVYVFEIL